MDNIFKNKAKEKGVNVTDLRILKVLVTRLLRRDLNRLIKEMALVELWDEG
jgi:hypothetical protein